MHGQLPTQGSSLPPVLFMGRATGRQCLLMSTAAGVTLNQARRRRNHLKPNMQEEMDFNARQCHFYYSTEQPLSPDSSFYD